MPTTFIGVDLAWQGTRNHSGIAVAIQNESGAILTALSDGITSFESAAGFIAGHASANTVVAIDAPLVITNATGRRRCETLISRKFGARHAGAHSSNLTLYPGGGPARLVGMLAEKGFTHDLDVEHAERRDGRWIFEVYPHPAQVVLFDLPKIIRYKKGSTVEKRSGLAILRQYLADVLPRSEPSLAPGDVGTSFLQQDLSGLVGMALKRYEDLLDAWFCTYLALYLWWWGSERNELLGDLESGYIVVPTRSCRSLPPMPRTEDSHMLILPPGTRVVASDVVTIGETGKQLPAGAVGVIVKTPADRSEAYRIRFLTPRRQICGGPKSGSSRR